MSEHAADMKVCRHTTLSDSEFFIMKPASSLFTGK